MNIKDGILKKIFLLLLGTSILGIALFNLFIYPSFTNMVIADAEAEAVMIGRHISGMIFPEYFQNIDKLTPETVTNINRSAEEFNLYKLKVFLPSGEIAYSTDPGDIGRINDRDYFRSVVARGKPFTELARKGRPSLEDEAVGGDVVETYIPIMRNGTFVGALEIYLDITEKMRMLQHAFLLCIIVSFALAALFCVIVMAAFVQIDRTIHDRQRINRNLSTRNVRLQREIEGRKQSQEEKEKLIANLQSSLEKAKMLSGYIPICSCCKKIRDDQGGWNQIEMYIRDHSEAEFTHGICPDCANEHYGELFAFTSPHDTPLRKPDTLTMPVYHQQPS